MIVHIGEALIDFIPVADEAGRSAYRPAPGGSPYNAAIASARLGVPAAFLGTVSTDFFGDQLVDNLRDNGVSTEMIVRPASPSTLAFVKKTPAGEARYAFFTNGAADRALTAAEIPTLPAAAAAVQFGSISLIADPTGSTILDFVEDEGNRRVVSFDPNIRTVLVDNEADYRSRVERGIAASTIVKVSDEDLEWIAGTSNLEAAAREMVGGGVRLVVVTLGDKGSFACTADHTVRVQAVPTAVSDTIGAGDSFHAAILAWLYHEDVLRGDRIGALSPEAMERMLEFAGTVAAGTCSRPGADPPRLSDIDGRFLSQR
ncbi:MAG: carbohydrate kinase [Spirochaetales bacterium]|nr:carbohydrate kinase [Spirochaetales bacterium]